MEPPPVVKSLHCCPPAPPLPLATAVLALLSSVTAPFRANARPVTLVPVMTGSLVSARMLPAKTVSVSGVAELFLI